MQLSTALRFGVAFHTYPCKRIGRAHDCFEVPHDEKLYNKKMDISDVAMENVLPFLPAKMLCRLRTNSLKSISN
ncbi:hypothetical protein DVH24_029880 [Malus domestica]|uniref:Uncharacterized protein n=1 Tax=Malus domestica TaxID=3750 RepID=A0A498HX01_MALDO|nr:hypothetical protein DVH24_029880 [Malus domestica]